MIMIVGVFFAGLYEYLVINILALQGLKKRSIYGKMEESFNEFNIQKYPCWCNKGDFLNPRKGS